MPNIYPVPPGLDLARAEERGKMRRLLRRVPKENFLHRAFDAVTGNLREDTDVVPILLEVLRIEPEVAWRERLAAVTALGTANIAPKEEIPVAIGLGNALHSKYDAKVVIAARRGGVAFLRSFQWLTALTMSGIALYVLVTIVPLLLPLSLLPFLVLVVLFFSTPLLFLGSSVHDSVRAWDVRVAAAVALRKLQLTGSTVALAKAARGDNRIASECRTTLYALLPKLTPDDFRHLGSDATPELCGLLRTSGLSEGLQDKLLTALEKVGDGRAWNR